MKTKKLNKLLTDSKKIIDYSKEEISINIFHKGDISALVNHKKEIYTLDTDCNNLTEVQQDAIFKYLIELWKMHFDNSFNSEFTIDDKFHALSLIR